jgi:hypothetical protein
MTLADLVRAVEKKAVELQSGELAERGDWNRKLRDYFIKVKNALRAPAGSSKWSPKKLMPEELNQLLKELDLLFASKGVLALILPRNLQVHERLALAPWPLHFIRGGTFYKDVSDLAYGVGYDLGSAAYSPDVEIVARISSARDTWQNLLNNQDDSAQTDLVRALLLFLRYENRYEAEKPDWSDPNVLLRQLMGSILFSGSEGRGGRKFNEEIVNYFQETGATSFRPWRFHNLKRAEILAGFDEIVFRLFQDSRVHKNSNGSLFNFLRQAERNAVTTQDMVTQSLL